MPFGNAAAEEEVPAAGRPARTRVSRLRLEASGALAALIVAIPQAISLGVLAFAALGPEYAGEGALAGLLASVIGNFAASASYGVRCQIVGARSASTTLVAALMVALAAHPLLQRAGVADPAAVVAFTFAAVAISGVVQFVFGIAGVGRSIKYVPYPVVAGFMNGIAIVILLAQLRPALGLDGAQPLSATLGELAQVRWGAVATVAGALATIFALPRFAPRFPILVGGLLAGIAVHYAIRVAWPDAVGGVVGPLPDLSSLAGQPAAVLEALGSLPRADTSLIQLLFAQALLLGIVGALDSLLAAVIVDGVLRGRHDSNRVLTGIGLGNVVSAFVGVLPSQVNAHTPLANHAAGGRTRLSTFLHAIFALLVVAALAPAVAHIPLAALAGVMLYIAYSLADRWSGDLLRRVPAARDDRGEIAINIAIVAGVAIAQVAMNVVAALAVGVLASVALLVVKLSGSPVKRQLDGRARASHKVRNIETRERLHEMAHRIRVFELQGELFFGTADSLQSDIDRVPAGTRFVILDFRRVHQIDATGGRVLQLIAQRAARRDITVLLSDVRRADRRGRYLAALGLEGAIPFVHWFADLDRALEWAEDRLLDQPRFHESAREEIPLAQMALFHGLEPPELEKVTRALERIELRNGDHVFLEGEEGDRLYLIARGAVSIKVKLEGEGRARRLATFAPGVMFGEMALLEGKHRSADAFAKGENVVLYALSRDALERLTREEPQLALRLHRNLGRELAARLRDTSEQLRALE
jgi:MFS superfamily sulfate permease-like transporter/CRP-like cAMP-binding protein